jgi:hypothetical protein
LEKRDLTDRLCAAEATGAVFFGDEMRLGTMGQTRRVWAPARGFEIVQQREIGYQYEYLNLAVNPMTGELKWDWTSDMKSASLSAVVENWQESVEALVWDGAPGHRGSAYDEVGVERIQPRPPYSPELQPAERVFEYLRARVEGILYGRVESKKAAVEKALRELAACRERVKRLTGWSWIKRSIIGARLLNTPLL